MKELMIQVKIDKHRTLTAIKKQGFEENISSGHEIIGILHSIIKIEQDKMAEKSTTVTQSETQNGKGKV